MFKSIIIHRTIFAFLLLLFAGVTAFGQGTAFTYQGRLTESGNPADGLFDMRFKLFDTATVGTGTQQGSTITNPTVQVENGAFSVQLDFSPCASCFNGAARFLEISLRPAGSPDAFAVLSPRQPITSTPYALRSAIADTATNATQLGGQTASGFIQNTTSQQAGTDFNISGSGTAGGTLTGRVINAVTQYNIGGLRMLAANGAFNNGLNNLAASNTFLGESAGLNTTPSAILSSFGGKLNSFFGAEAGKANTTGFSNSFFGVSAGLSNTTGSHNAFFGFSAGKGNTTASGNSFFGREAGVSNTTGNSNAFFGFAAGFSNDSGSFNIFVGQSAGDSNVSGFKNTVIGYDADVGAAGLSNATAIGANASVTQSNSLVLGGITGVNGGTSVNVGIGTTAPAERLHVVGNGLFTGNLTASGSISIAGLKTEVTATTPNVIGGFFANVVTAGVRGAFIGGGGDSPFNNRVTDNFGVVGGGRDNLAANNSGTNFDGGHATVGGGEANTASGAHATVAGGSINNATGTDAAVGGGFGNTASGVHATVPGGSRNVAAGDDSFAAGNRAQANHQGTFVWADSTSADFASTANDQFLIRASGGVGIGTNDPDQLLTVNGNASKTGGGSWATFSDERLKTIRGGFTAGLNQVLRLQPIRYEYRPDNTLGIQAGQEHVGFAAQAVERVIPEAVSRNSQGFLLVNNDPILWAMLNAIKELKAENDSLKQRLDEMSREREEIKQQQTQIESLKKIICLAHPNADICK
jgi:hypothetical protein